jgi:hypothetical protein
LKLNGTDQVLVYADAVNMLGESLHTTKKKHGDLLVTSKGISVEVNAKKTKYMVMFRDQNIIHSFSSLSYDRSKASSKSSSPHSAI